MTDTGRLSAGFDARSRWVDLGGPLHYMDFGGPRDGPLVVAVHGLGGAAMNFSAIAPMLTRRCRLLAPDLAGHGLTESLGRSTKVGANRRLLHDFVEAVARQPVILMGNSMGGMVSLLQAAAEPQTVAGLILLAPAVPFLPAVPDPWVAAVAAVYGLPVLGRIMVGRRRTLPPDKLVAWILGFCCVDPSRVPAEVLAEHVELARRRIQFDDVERDFLVAARSVAARAAVSRGVSYRHVIRSVSVPVLVVHGERDRVVPMAASQAAASQNPSWRLVILPDVGHVPQLEASDVTAEVILDWLDREGHSAVSAACPRSPNC